MKYAFLFILLLPIYFVSAQTQLQKRVDLTFEKVLLEDALVQLSEATETNISFSNKIIPNNLFISVDLVDESLKQALRIVLKRTDLSFKIVSNQIVIYKRALDQFESIRISGIVEDKETGEKLIGANVYDPNNSSGTNTNDFGFFSLNVLKGKSIITISYTGYETYELVLDSEMDQNFSIKLESSLSLPPIIVSDENFQNDFQNSNFSNLKHLDLEQIKKLPSLGGEPDIMRTLYNDTGVSTGADGVGGLHVRGGGIDQNLLLMDGVPIYNPLHAIGIFSVYNTDAVKNATFYKGAYPAKFSGRLSSILDVQTKDGNLQMHSGEIALGLISGKASIEGPIIKDKASYIITLRKSFTDYYLPKITSKVKESNDRIGASNYSFWDLNAKLNFKLSKNDRLFLSIYKGEDSFIDSTKLEPILDTISNAGGFRIPYVANDREIQSLDWGNQTISLRWNRIFGDKLFVNTNLYSSHYTFKSLEDFESRAIYEDEEMTEDLIAIRRRHISDVQDIGLRSDFEYLPDNQTRLQFGFALINHKFSPGTSNQNTRAFNVIGLIDSISLGDTLSLASMSADEFQIYIGGSHFINDKIKAEIGVNTSFWKFRSDLDFSIQPRLAFNLQLSNNLSAQISATKMSQFPHLLTNSDIGLPSDIWLPATKNAPAEISYQSQISLKYKIKHFGSFTIGGYYKKMENLLEYLDANSSFIIDANNWEENIVLGEGLSYGFEMSLTKEIGKLKGVLNYTYAKTDRFFEEINDGKRFPYRFDLRHTIYASLSREINKKLNISLAWLYQSGINITFPKRKVVVSSNIIDFPTFGIPDQKNGLKVNPNHKLDISINYQISNSPKFKQTLNLGVYNAYNNKNPIYYKIQRNADNGESLELVQVSLFTILPNLSYSIRF